MVSQLFSVQINNHLILIIFLLEVLLSSCSSTFHKIKGIQLQLVKEVSLDFQFEKNYYRTISELINDSLFVINPQDHSLSKYLLFYNTNDGKLLEKLEINSLKLLYPNFYFINQDSIIVLGTPYINLQNSPRCDSSIAIISLKNKNIHYYSLEGLPIYTYSKSQNDYSETFYQRIQNILYYDKDFSKIIVQLGYEAPYFEFGDTLLRNLNLPNFGIIDIKNDTSYPLNLRVPSFTYDRYWPNSVYASITNYKSRELLLSFNHTPLAYIVDKKTYHIKDSINLFSNYIDTVSYGGYNTNMKNQEWHYWISQIENNYGNLVPYKDGFIRLNYVRSEDYSFRKKSLQIFDKNLHLIAEDLIHDHFFINGIKNDTIISFEPISPNEPLHYVLRYYLLKSTSQFKHTKIEKLNKEKHFVSFLKHKFNLNPDGKSAYLIFNPRIMCPCIPVENICNQYQNLLEKTNFKIIIISPFKKELFEPYNKNKNIIYVDEEDIYPFIKHFVNFRYILLKNETILEDKIPPLHEVIDIPNRISKFFNE